MPLLALVFRLQFQFFKRLQLLKLCKLVLLDIVKHRPMGLHGYCVPFVKKSKAANRERGGKQNPIPIERETNHFHFQSLNLALERGRERMGHHHRHCQQQQQHPAVDSLVNLLTKANHDLTVVHYKLEKEFQQLYPQNANPMKLVSRINKIQEDVTTLKEQCRELLSAKQDLIDKARTILVGNRNMLQRMQASVGISAPSDSDDPAFANFNQVWKVVYFPSGARSVCTICQQTTKIEYGFAVIPMQRYALGNFWLNDQADRIAPCHTPFFTSCSSILPQLPLSPVSKTLTLTHDLRDN